MQTLIDDLTVHMFVCMWPISWTDSSFSRVYPAMASMLSGIDFSRPYIVIYGGFITFHKCYCDRCISDWLHLTKKWKICFWLACASRWKPGSSWVGFSQKEVVFERKNIWTDTNTVTSNSDWSREAGKSRHTYRQITGSRRGAGVGHNNRLISRGEKQLG